MKKYFKILIGILLVSNLSAETNQKKFNGPKMTEPFADSYYGSISERLAAWTPIGNNQKATIIITIDENGKFDYSFLKESTSKEFNESLKAFLNEQKNVRYPVYMNRAVKINVDFKSVN